MEEGRKKTWFVYYLPRWGCLSTGIVYTAIGIIAILSFLKLKEGGADEDSLLVFLNRYFIGKLFVGFILLGMVAFISWRIYETIRDPYGYGTSLKGILRRGVTALSGFADALIAFSAVQTLSGKGGLEDTGQPTAQRELARQILSESWGDRALLVIGIITGIVALGQVGYVLSRAYRERMDIDQLVRWKRTAIQVLAWAGHFARGIIIGIMGYFLIKAALSGNPQYVVNTDKAFDFIGDDVGHGWFIIVAAGTICYGLFMFVFGAYHDPDKD
ncbi:DUF1206 domain-containing protein [Paraflavisolibacter sp. H34]|uniref:DUF1206 domain-containing protein n=1 Tax=Huijunlia imazamoxiresistens TaxID=3127457 RepID=UPI003016249F